MAITTEALAFHRTYGENHASVKSFVPHLVGYFERQLENEPYQVHLIDGRAKSPDSLMAKIRQKGYSDPARDVTDLIGVRVITYYEDDVDRVASRLRESLTLDEHRSIDKRQLLPEAEFGYRSVHLVATIPEIDELAVVVPTTIQSVEIQVRSFLEHAWAETEHEIVYKSGIDFPSDIKRRIYAIAGTLHILDREFVSLRNHQDSMVDLYVDVYRNGREGATALDATRLAALLQVLSPEDTSWRSDHLETGRRYRLRDAAICTEALKQAGIVSGNAFRAAFDTAKVAMLRETYAAEAALASNEVSHFALSVLTVAAVQKAALDDFPDLVTDAALSRVIGELA